MIRLAIRCDNFGSQCCGGIGERGRLGPCHKVAVVMASFDETATDDPWEVACAFACPAPHKPQGSVF
jgi:hypothetical protein